MMLIRTLSRWYVTANDHNEVGRRALVQVLALRPGNSDTMASSRKRLDALVPERITQPPDRPIFRPAIRLCSVAWARGLSASSMPSSPHPDIEHASKPGSWLLYSVGPDRAMTVGSPSRERVARSPPMDLVFEIPPVEDGDGKGQTLE